MSRREVDLVPMTEAEYVEFEERVIREYADESAAAGRVSEDLALEWSRRETRKFLPHGLRTKDTFILTITSSRHPGAALGSIWCAKDAHDPKHAFIFDLFLHPSHRRQGYGEAAMTALEPFLRDRGFTAVGLHVYAKNHAASSLYRKLGYQTTSLNLRKEL